MQEHANDLLLNPYIFAVFFATMWCLTCFLIAVVSGWFVLSGRFRKQGEPYGETRTAGPLFFGIYMRFWAHYSGVVRMTAAEDALYLSVIFPFRIGHPPLRIPWTEIEFSQTKYFWRRYVVLTLGQQERIPMRISERMARKVGIMEKVVPASMNVK